MEKKCKDEDQFSDEEVFFGKLTLKELKKHILWDKQREPWSLSATNSPATNINDPNTSLRIIQTQSEPNLRPGQCDYLSISPTQTTTLNSPNYKFMDENDSFIKMENMVEQISLAAKSNEKTDFNNTLEVIEYILNNPPSHNVKSEIIKDEELDNPNEPIIKCEVNLQQTSLVPVSTCGKEENDIIPEPDFATNHELNTSLDKPLIKLENNNLPSPPTPKVSPLKIIKKALKNDPLKTVITPSRLNTPRKEVFTTPLESKSKAIFKTPGQPLTSKKPSATSLKKTPNKTNAYQHISSPIASYIKNCPVAPLVKDVHPKKPLVGVSSIPKFVKTCPKSNKENVNLPSVAYKSAKKTKLIDIPDENKLPQSHWAKKITSTLPKPVVIKHNHREVNMVKKALLHQQEDSFADLTYHQAEVSVCTQKSAFK